MPEVVQHSSCYRDRLRQFILSLEEAFKREVRPERWPASTQRC